jgi:hypothetical protein
MKTEEKFLKQFLLIIAIISHFSLIFVLTYLFDNEKDETISMRILWLTPIISEVCLLVMVLGKDILYSILAFIPFASICYYFYLKCFKNRDVNEIRKFAKTVGMIMWVTSFIYPLPFIEVYYTLTEKYVYQWRAFFNFLGLVGIIGLVYYLAFNIFIIYLPRIINYFLAKIIIVKNGLGLFTPKTLNDILIGKCSICNSDINDNSIFGNSLIIAKNEISLICAKCRTGIDIPVQKSHSKYTSIDRGDVLLYMKKYPEKFAIQTLISLRQLKINQNDPENYYGNFRRADYKYGVLEGNHCGECGEYFYEMPEVESNEDSNFIENGVCPHCKLPHKFQWFLRTTFEEESDALVTF